MAQEIVEVPLTGKITTVNVEVGDEIEEGDVICLLESMKMENPIVAPVAGKIIQLGVTSEQIVNPGEIVAVIDYLES